MRRITTNKAQGQGAGGGSLGKRTHPRISVVNTQHRLPVSTSHIARLARCAIRRLRIRTPGKLAITFIDPRRMRVLNKRFCRHDRLTDVLSFRYDGEPVVGDILIAPAAARSYAQRHGIPYAEELSRYVLHGLLHWLGHDDRTPAQQRKMRTMEDQLLASSLTDWGGGRARSGDQARRAGGAGGKGNAKTHAPRPAPRAP